MPTSNIVQQFVTTKTTIIGIAISVISIAVLFIAEKFDIGKETPFDAVIDQAFTTLLAAGALSVVWDLVGRRTFTHELLEKTNLSHSVVNTGLINASMDWLSVIDWSESIRNSHEIEAHVSYSTKWFTNRQADFTFFLKSPRNKFDIYLPNPNNPDCVRALSLRFRNGDDEWMRRTLNESLIFFKELQKSSKATLQVHLYDGVPLYSSYRFNEKILVTFYSHSKDRVAVPSMLFNTGGEFGQFFKEDLSALSKHSDELVKANIAQELTN